MSTPRRRLVRPAPATASRRPHSDQQVQKLRARLTAERAALARWMTRLKPAFHTVERTQVRIVRLERRLAQEEE
jgi:hypothetical protein